jgi:glycosyltransferase involved in cell wall biosynthesis
MRIALYTGTYIKDQDGATKTLYALTESLLKRNFEIGIWSPAITPQDKKGLSFFKLPSVPLILYRDYKFAFPFGGVKKQLKKFEPDLIQVTAPDLAGIYFLKFATKRKIPVVASCHTDWASYLSYYHLSVLTNWVWRSLVWFYNKSDSVYAPTKIVAEELRERNVENVKVWARGIDRSKYHPRHKSKKLREDWKAHDRKVILYTGRFVWYKDLDVFFSVYSLFKEKGPDDVRFVLAGDGPIREELKRRMPEAHFPGYLHDEELSRIYASADIFLFPSTTETLGNAVQEALSSGLPSVVSDVGGCREIIQRSDGGFVAKAKDPYSFYEKCRLLIEDEEIYKQKRENGLNFAEEQKWEKINGRLIDDFIDLIEKRSEELDYSASSEV